jgi:hypothetical protein
VLYNKKIATPASGTLEVHAGGGEVHAVGTPVGAIR